MGYPSQQDSEPTPGAAPAVDGRLDATLLAAVEAAQRSAAGPTARHVDLILRQLDSLPTLSAVATRLLKLTDAADPDLDEIISVLEADPALAGRMLSLCRRASNGVSQNVTSVRRAVVLLGIEAVHSVVLSVQIYEVFAQACGSFETRNPDDPAAPGFDRVGFWMHSVATACCAELLAEAHRELKVRPEEAFTAGLVHDLGKLVLDWILPQTYARVVQMADARAVAIGPIEESVIGIDHHAVGKHLGEHWSLPHSLQDVMWLHGQPLAALPDIRHRSMIAIVTAADALVRRLHLGWSGSHGEPPSIETIAADSGLKPDLLREVAPRLHEALAKRSRDLGLSDHTSPELVLRSISQANQRLSRLHQLWRERSDASKHHARALECIERFVRSARPGATLDAAVARVGESFCQLAGRGFLAAVVQTRPGEPWRLARCDADGSVLSMEVVAPPVDRDSKPSDLATMATDASLGGAVALTGWLGRNLKGGPDTGTLRTLPLNGGAGPVMLLVHDRPELERAVGKRSLETILGVWSSAIASASQHEGARRLTEALAATTRVLTETQSQLTEAQSMARLGELTAGAAHELNNPLTVISGRAQMLAARLADAQQKAEAMHIADAAQRMTDMVSRLHVVARPPEPKLAPTNLADLLAESIKRAKEQFAQDRPGSAIAAVRLIMQPPLDLALVDRELAVRALSEIVCNGLEAEPATGMEVRVAVDPIDDRLVITVRDDGRGMTEHTIAHAFDPFFSDKPAGRQTGLGLPIARRLLGAMNAQIRLESSGSRGTTATVRFSRWRAAQTAQSRAA